MRNFTKKAVIKFVCHMSRVALLFLWISLTSAGMLMASGVESQNLHQVKVKVSGNGVPLKSILAELEKQSGFSFYFARKIGNINPVVVSENAASLYDILLEIAIDKKLIFKQTDRMIAVMWEPPPPPPILPGTLAGKITDEKGEPLAGVSMKVVEIDQQLLSGTDGGYLFSLKPATYTLEVSVTGFVTQRITGIVIQSSANTPLNIAMKPDLKMLKGVTVSTGYKKASVEGLLTRQKNASEISNGISAEQIGSTPDKNIGESLKRISGVSTVENKFVIVRGIGERYNAAMLDGVVLPSTEAQTRNFSFDLIPANMVDNVIVSKAVTPDMNASFGGGLVQINTKDIPAQNFTSIGAGASYNDQSTGKEFLSHKRGKYDYLGFSGSNRSFPDQLYYTDRTVTPNNTMGNEEYQQKVLVQSKRFTNDNFTIYRNKALPSQNYQFAMGRSWILNNNSSRRLGFTGSVSYRNTQQINQFDQQRRSDWLYDANNYGAAYSFNTTIGALLNVGLQWGKNRFSFRNTFTRLYDNTLVRTIGYDADNGGDFFSKGLLPNRIQEVDDPTFTTLMQNKINGQHQLGKVTLEWNLARTGVSRKEKDLSIATAVPELIGKEYEYFYATSRESEPRINPSSRHNYQNKENHYSWSLDGTMPFTVGGMRNSLKAGYFGTVRKASFDWQIAALTASNWLADSLRYIPVSEMVNPANFGANGYNYNIATFFLDAFEGKSTTQAGYVMFDSRLLQKLRLVWGVRAEYYKYTEIKNGLNQAGDPKKFHIPTDNAWQWLPSANLTYSPVSQLNIRAAFSGSVIRPELMDNSQFFKYNPYLSAPFGNQGLASTRINNYDVKVEWFPGLGELLSAGAFYKEFEKPIELTFILVNGNINYYQTNASRARVYGLELEMRKNFAFIAPGSRLLSHLTAYGNLTLQKSSVRATYRVKNPSGGNDLEVEVKQNRTMYGQSPYLINGGLQYQGERLGLNVAYNKSGTKTYIVSSLMNQIEYEAPREQMDAQISYKLCKKKLEVKLNAGNLLNSVSMFYVNTGSYEKNPDSGGGSDQTDSYRLKAGFSDKYEEGDQIRLRQKFGRTYSATLTYTF